MNFTLLFLRYVKEDLLPLSDKALKFGESRMNEIVTKAKQSDRYLVDTHLKNK